MHIITDTEQPFSEEETTPFGEEVGLDEIHWWVFRKESDLEELDMKTKETLALMQKLKEDSQAIKNKSLPKSYQT